MKNNQMTKLKPNSYKLLEKAVSDGVEYGYNRALKYDSNPPPEYIKDTIVQAVLLEIHEWFDWDSE
jgi:hypothetical protein